MRAKAAQITLAIICLLVGVMLVIQFRTQTKIQRSLLTEPAANQALIISNLYDNNLELRKEVDDLARQLDQYQDAGGRTDVATMAEELNQLRVATGLGAVSGPGVEMRIEAPLTREDVLDLINELRNAGAEALALNDHRIVAASAVSLDQGTVALDGAAIRPPYLFRAVGQPDTIEGALVRKGGVLTIVQNAYAGGVFSVNKLDKVVLPAYSQGYQWKFARQADKS